MLDVIDSVFKSILFCTENHTSDLKKLSQWMTDKYFCFTVKEEDEHENKEVNDSLDNG